MFWGAVVVSGQHLQLQIWMSWFWSFMKLKPSSGTRFATLTNIRLKIIAYHQTMSSIYNWEFDCKHLSHLMIWTSQFWSHSFSVNNGFDHATDHHASDPVLTLSLPMSFMQCTLHDRKWNLRQGQDWTWPLPMIHCFTCCLRIECKSAVLWSYIVYNLTKLSKKDNCCSFISAYNFPFTKFTFCIKILLNNSCRNISG